MQMEGGGGGGGVTHFVFEIRRVENYPKFDKFSCYSRQFFLQLVPQFARRVQVARNVALRNTCTTPKKIRCSVTRIVAKSRTDFYFSQRLRHQKSCERCSFQGVLHWAIFRATCIATKLRDKLQKKGNRSMTTVTNIATLYLSFMECKYVSSTYSTCSTKSTCSSSSTCSTTGTTRYY